MFDHFIDFQISKDKKARLLHTRSAMQKASSIPEAKWWIDELKKTEPPQFDQSSPELRIADLFSGCGGLSLGALLACQQLRRRLHVALAADIWEEALRVYDENFCNVLERAVKADLYSLVEKPGSMVLSAFGRELAEEAGELDVVVAGPPCQGHSDLNNSSRRDDPRNELYTVPVAFALQTRAKLILVENVPTVVHAKGRVVTSAYDLLVNHGYAVVEFVADAQNFGLPQTRKRHLLIASRLHTVERLSELLKRVSCRHQDIPLWGFIEDLEFELEDPCRLVTKRSKISLENQERIDYLFETGSYDLPNDLRPPCHRDKAHSYVSMYGRLNPHLPAQTITSGFGSMGQGRFVHPMQRRMITPHEAARIQGFPDYFDFSAVKKVTALREIIGNAVPPPVAAVLLALLFSNQT